MANVRLATVPGVAPANERSWHTERRVAAIVVTIPFLCILAAIAMFWNNGLRTVDLALLVTMYSLTVFGIGIGFHRLISHRAFATKPWMRLLFAALGSMAAQGPVLYWAAIHRRHHSFADRPGDPHSPYLDSEAQRLGPIRGFAHAHTGWLFHHEITDWVHYVPDLLRDRALFRVSGLYFFWVGLGLLIPAVVGFLATPTLEGAALGMLWGGLVRIGLVHHTTWSVNSICHIFGRRPYQIHDQSRNNFWIALIAFGEGWHNNHHAFPSSAMHGLRSWQIDLCGYVIRLLTWMGLAWDLKQPPSSRVA